MYKKPKLLVEMEMYRVAIEDSCCGATYDEMFFDWETDADTYKRKLIKEKGSSGVFLELINVQVGPLFNNKSIAQSWLDLESIKTGDNTDSYKIFTCKFNEE